MFYVYPLQLLCDTYQCSVIGSARVMREEDETAERGGGVDARSLRGFLLDLYETTMLKVIQFMVNLCITS